MKLISFLKNVLNLLEVSFFVSLRYMLVAGGLFAFFYIWKRYWFSKIQQKYPSNKHVFHEIKHSFFTIIIFSMVILTVMWASLHRYTLIYSPINKYGYPYFFLSIILMVLLNDAYFYWTHRLLHWKPMFKYVHKTHHIPHNPTPFSAYCFHWVEAFIEVGIIPLICFTIPYHLVALGIYSGYTMVLNIAGHLGFEFFPKGFARNKWFKWHNSATHHNMHHRFVKYNYGLYFNFWDRWMGTNHPKYEEYFDEVIEQRERLKALPKPETVDMVKEQ